MFYGTTFAGGEKNAGTVFTITRSGKESVLYSFTGKPDGDAPHSDLIVAKGKLYGTTVLGGASSRGPVFEISTSGNESVLHSFKGGKDGESPYAPLVAVKNVLYGTTYYGGAGKQQGRGFGTIFSVKTSGDEHVLYRFKGPPDGAFPKGGLINVQGTLYGTTSAGRYERSGDDLCD